MHNILMEIWTKNIQPPTPHVVVESIDECRDSPFVKPQRIKFTHDGKPRVWDMIKTFDAVVILLYDKELDSIIIVRQLRPPVFVRNGVGYTYELCAGLVDKEGKSLEEVAREEVLEECGYDVPVQNFNRMTAVYSQGALTTTRATYFYAFVDSSMKVSKGGGLEEEGEKIDVVYLPLSNLDEFISDEDVPKNPGLLFAATYFLHYILPRHK